MPINNENCWEYVFEKSTCNKLKKSIKIMYVHLKKLVRTKYAIRLFINMYLLSHSAECNMGNILQISHILQVISRVFRGVK